MMKDFLLSIKIKIIQMVVIILFFQQMSSDESPVGFISSCSNINDFSNDQCFNNIIEVGNCKEGQFGEDKNGNMFVLYSKDSGANNRLFYGLNKNGTNYFGNSPIKEYNLNNGYPRVNSRIIFLNIEENNKQYLLSTSTGYTSDSSIELYEIGNNDITNSKSINIKSLLNLHDSINSDQYSLLKISDQNKYFLVFTEGYTISIIKFAFNSPNLNDFQKIEEKEINGIFSNDVVSAFLMEEEELLVLFYMKSWGGNANYTRAYYDYDNLNLFNEEIVPNVIDNIYISTFFKGLFLKGTYSAFIYSAYYHSNLIVKLNMSSLDYNIDDDNNKKYYFENSKQVCLEDSSDRYISISDIMNNDFIKINDYRLVFISMEDINEVSDGYSSLLIVLFDLRGNDYQFVGTREFYYSIDNINALTAHVYNNFLVLSLLTQPGEGPFTSFLVFFGYPRATDHSINIIPYLNSIGNIGNENTNNIYKYLMSIMNLDNNIFGYEPVDKINLVTMSREILLYNISEDGTQEIGPLSANSFFGVNHILKQNLKLRTTNEDYYFDYQYLVKEPENFLNSFDYNNNCNSGNGNRRNLRNDEEYGTSNKLFYGRVNRITFKLCETDICEPLCSFDSYLKKECVITGTDQEIITQVIELISLYRHFTKTLSIELSNNHFIEISNDMKEKLFETDTNLSWLDIGKCADKIRAEIPRLASRPLIILKFGASSDSAFENYVIFKIFDPDTFEEIPLSICKDINIDLYIDTRMSQSVSSSVEEMVDQGYNPFDLNDKFYREICTPYESPDGTDVLLDDREEYFYNQLNKINCPDGCGTSAYPLDSKYLKCECPVEDDVTLDLKHISGDNVKKSIKSTFKNSNWKAMLCYNLVFDGEIFGKNIGAIITLILFFIYICFFVYYVMEGITPLQNSVAELMTAEDEKKEEAEKKAQDKEKNPAVISFKNPPKKSNSGNDDNKDRISSVILIDDKKDNDINIVTLKDNKNEKRNSNPSVTDKDLSKIHIKKDSIYTEEVNLNVKKVTETVDDDEKYKDLDDFQLNNLEYKEACRYDKRSFLKTYWSVLKREHIIIFTFISRNDHNLFYVKIERFLILLCTQLFMNGLFFTDDSMHKATKSTDYSFAQQLPKIIFSLIGTHLIEVFLCYLSMTDTVMYEVKDLTKRKHTEQVIAEKINTMKKKLIVYFIVTLVLFAFYWYFVAAFCAVFQNTQKIFLLDFLIGTLLGYIDPFVIYLLKEILRYLSLTKLSDRKGAIVYKISDLIPIF